MVYLPARAIPAGRGARRPGAWACLLALTLPLRAATPVALAILALNPPPHAFAPVRQARETATLLGYCEVL
jgi:hypothetical protein